VVEPILPTQSPPDGRRPLLGYGMVWTAATLFAFNGTIAKVILEAEISSPRLSQVRSTGALVGLGLVVLLVARQRLRIGRAELPSLVVFGIAGVGFVQLFYFVAIHRLPIGIALLIQFLAPLGVAIWARYVRREPVRRRIWIALALSLTGLALIVRVWTGFSLDGWGVAAALAGAVAFGVYILMAERAVSTRDPVSLTLYGFLFAAGFWAVIQPWWTFPFDRLGDHVSLLGNLADRSLPMWTLMAAMVVVGTIVPFGLVVGALRHIPATRLGIVAMLEPVAATVVAFAWLDETLGSPQLLGGAVVLAGIVLAQTAR
jgi:drug/metabolite transporter (DMT)-like permease